MIFRSSINPNRRLRCIRPFLLDACDDDLPSIAPELSKLEASLLPQLIIRIWDGVSREEMENLVDSMPNRLAATVQAQGGPNGHEKHSHKKCNFSS
jgi:hypothetical protein